MDEEWITIGFVCKMPIEDIPEIRKYLANKGIIVFSRISAGRLFLREASPIGEVHDVQ